MKNIAVFTALVIILWALPCPQARGQGHILSALPDTGAGFPYALTLAASTGFLYGYGEELVYKYPGKETYMSQLLWNIKPLFYYGAALDFSRIRPLEKPGFFALLSLKFGFPAKTGIMEDLDWLTVNDELTNYSLSDNYTNGAFLFDVFLGASLPLGDFALIKLQWGFSLMSFQWTGRDGYRRYSSNENTPLDDSVGPVPFYGILILYAQNWLITSPGLALQIPLSRHFRTDLFFQISPFIFCNARDDHVLRNLEFLDYVSGGLYLEPRGDFVFSFWERFELSLYVSYRYIRGAHGESYQRSTGGSGQYLKTAEDAGAAWYALDSGLTFKVRL
ncbi:MAG: omptin family outer membrane protease [Treponema sp.]|jgi:outer membrane protease|nr:omptin family outer membrane protease [Treponema sp.]